MWPLYDAAIAIGAPAGAQSRFGSASGGAGGAESPVCSAA